MGQKKERQRLNSALFLDDMTLQVENVVK